MRILAVTSGKGGVGKTTLSLNIAKQLSLAGIRTILVDLDIHNKGATSLFLDKVEDEGAKNPGKSVMGLLAASRSAAGKSPKGDRALVCPLDSKGLLLFLPATQAREMITWSALQGSNSVIKEFLSSMLSELAHQFNCEVAILDCYGGIDSLTVAAVGAAKDTIIVNEPDLITFSGTLLLYSYLSETYKDAQQKPHIHFVINRITSRHSFEFLESEYRKNLTPLASDDRILAYLPFDRLVMETFGDYPFFTELLPGSLITRKIRLALCQLWGESPFRNIAKLSKRARRRLFQRTSESQFAEPDAILRAFVSIPIWIILPASIILLLPAISLGRAMSYFVIWQLIHIPLVILILLLFALSVFEPIQISRWLFRVAHYQRRKRALRKRYGILARLILTISQTAYAALPALAGVCFAVALGVNRQNILPTGDTHTFDWRDINGWKGAVYGIRPGSNLNGLIMSPGASISPGSDLSNVQFVSAQIEDVSFEKVNLRGANFTGANAVSTSFRQSNLYFANFASANLAGADFSGAQLGRATFKDANMPLLSAFKDVDWHGANLVGANAEAALLAFAKLRGATVDPAQDQAAGAWFATHPELSAGSSFDAIVAANLSNFSSGAQAIIAPNMTTQEILSRFEHDRSAKLYVKSLSETRNAR